MYVLYLDINLFIDTSCATHGDSHAGNRQAAELLYSRSVVKSSNLQYISVQPGLFLCRNAENITLHPPTLCNHVGFTHKNLMQTVDSVFSFDFFKYLFTYLLILLCAEVFFFLPRL